MFEVLGAEPTEGEPDAWIECDESAIVTAVKNLVENAIHYSPERTTVRVVVDEDGDDVRIRVIDQGIGIPESAIGHIFERFYRVDKARSRATGGSGLGLAIVRAIVQRNRGEITVDSEIGKGTVFTVSFPVFETEVDES